MTFGARIRLTTESKTMQLDSLVTDMAKHFIEMGKVEGFRDYAKQRYLELLKDQSGLWDNLPAEIKRLKEQK